MMNRKANAMRGEMALTLGPRDFVLRPSFQSIVTVEEQLGGIIGVAIKASKGELGLRETAVLLWETLDKNEDFELSEEEFGSLIFEQGLAEVAPVVNLLLTAILKGSPRAAP